MNRVCWYKNKCKLESENCTENCLRYQNMNILIDKSGLPTNFQYPITLYPDEVDLESFEILAEAKNQISQLVKDGKSIYIWSVRAGNGKSTWASKILLAYFNNIWALSQLKTRGMYIYLPTLLNALKSQFLNGISISEYIQEIKECPLVILDELGCGKLSNTDINNLLDIVEFRLSNNKSTIFTSNLGENELRNLFGDRLTSRIYNSSLVVELKGSDKRGVAL